MVSFGSTIKSNILIGITSLGLGLLIGTSLNGEKIKGGFEIREELSSSTFTNPLLECDLGETYLSQGKARPSIKKLQSLINSKQESGDIVFASLYFRDLNNGPVIGINESEKFFPASLMKVPLAMYFYKVSESNPQILEQKVNPSKYPQMLYSSQLIEPETNISSTTEYTINELIEHAILYSDNRASELLINAMPENGLKTVLNDLHLEMPKNSIDDFFTVKEYSTFFRVLFNSSYLSKSNSEKILNLLSQTKFNEGSKAHIPKNILISSKFGERETNDSNIIQLHDCGIVYYPGHPYLICIMTRGTKIDALKKAIADISELVYTEVKTQTGK